MLNTANMTPEEREALFRELLGEELTKIKSVSMAPPAYWFVIDAITTTERPFDDTAQF